MTLETELGEETLITELEPKILDLGQVIDEIMLKDRRDFSRSTLNIVDTPIENSDKTSNHYRKKRDFAIQMLEMSVYKKKPDIDNYLTLSGSCLIGVDSWLLPLRKADLSGANL